MEGSRIAVMTLEKETVKINGLVIESIELRCIKSGYFEVVTWKSGQYQPKVLIRLRQKHRAYLLYEYMRRLMIMREEVHYR